MKKRDVTTRRAATEASLKRWQTRLTRAFNMVSKLEKQRRRLTLEELGKGSPVIATVKVKVPKPATAPEPEPVEDDPLKVPKWLDRSDPLIAEKMTAARKAAEVEERKKMPLSGSAASAYIKRKK